MSSSSEYTSVHSASLFSDEHSDIKKSDGPKDLFLCDISGRAEDFKSSEKSQISVLSLFCVPVWVPQVQLGFCRFGREGFQGREQSQGTTALYPSPPLAPFPVEVRVGINTHGTGSVPTPQEENNIFSSYMILVCSYVTRYLMAVK